MTLHPLAPCALVPSVSDCVLFGVHMTVFILLTWPLLSSPTTSPASTGFVLHVMVVHTAPMSLHTSLSMFPSFLLVGTSSPASFPPPSTFPCPPSSNSFQDSIQASPPSRSLLCSPQVGEPARGFLVLGSHCKSCILLLTHSSPFKLLFIYLLKNYLRRWCYTGSLLLYSGFLYLQRTGLSS